MKSTIKQLSDTKVLVTVSVEPSELSDAKNVALKKLSKNLKAPGFRKGHVPIGVASKHINPNTLNEEILNNALSRAVAEAFLNNDIQALERPSVEVKKYVPGETLEFTAEAEIFPKVELGNYRKFKLDKLDTKVTKKEIDEVIDRIRKSLAETKAVDRPAKVDDEVIIDFVGEIKGEVFDGGTASDFALTLGSKSLIPGFEEALVGLKATDKKDISLTFPKDYHAKNLAGKKVVFKVEVKKINQVILPQTDDDFAKKVGPFASLKELTGDIKKEIEAQKIRETTTAMKDNLVNQLVSASKVPVPSVLVDDHIQSIEQDLIQNLAYQGKTIDDYYSENNHSNREAWIEASAKSVAEFRVKAGLALAELGKQLKIEATPEELDEYIDKYKTSYSKDPELSGRFGEPAIKREMRSRLMTEKTIDRLLEINQK